MEVIRQLTEEVVRLTEAVKVLTEYIKRLEEKDQFICTYRDYLETKK